jgi:predicted nucleotide-binding protein (sugar kinase/HSP70/actin superfamily)
MFPILISFFGCGPDPFTVRHIQSAVKDKPLLILEMDEHSSKAGIMTRIEAFMDRLAQRGKSPLSKAPGTAQKNKPRSQISAMGLDTVYIPYFGEHAHILAATARSMGISAEVLPQPDEESAELGRAHLTGGECHPFALMLGDFLKLNKSLKEERAAKSMYAIPGFSACRLGQYPIYTEKIRKDLGIPMRVITDLSQSARSSGLPPSVRDMILMRMWEGLNAFDLLLAAYYSIRPRIRDHWAAEQAYSQARDSIVINLAMGRTSQGVKEAMAKLASLELDPEPGNQPIIAVTGDYYTRIVPFANNGVFEEIESLGGVVLPPPTFTDGVRYYYMKQALASGLQGASQDDASTFYPSAVLAQRKILSAAREHFPVNGLDPFSVKTLRKVAQYYDARFPAGIAAPVATLLGQLDQGIHGVLNLITLNCSYGTVVTATLSRALAERGDTPMLTLVYDGLKKTNERTRLEAFMDQAKDRMNRRGARATEDSLSK